MLTSEYIRRLIRREEALRDLHVDGPDGFYVNSNRFVGDGAGDKMPGMGNVVVDMGIALQEGLTKFVCGELELIISKARGAAYFNAGYKITQQCIPSVPKESVSFDPLLFFFGYKWEQGVELSP